MSSLQRILGTSAAAGIVICVLLGVLTACAGGGSGGTSGTGIRSLEGTIEDQNSAGLKNVTVTLIETGESTVTQDSGEYLLILAEDAPQIIALSLKSEEIDTSLSFESPSTAAETVTVDVRVNTSRNEVEEVRVSAPTPAPTNTATPESPAPRPTTTPTLMPEPTPTPRPLPPAVTPTHTPGITPQPTATTTPSPKTPCRADLNGDGLANSADQDIFLDLYAAGDPRADFDGNGVINTDDYTLFLSLLSRNCS